MLNRFIAVYLREILILRRRIKRQILSMSVSPLLYMIAFGYAMGKGARFDGHTYREFLIPGLVAMSSMTQAFAIAVDINVARFYWHIFEEFQAAPVSNTAYVAGEVLAGITRAMLSVVIILIIGLFFHVSLDYGTVAFWLAIALDSFVFASLAVALASDFNPGTAYTQSMPLVINIACCALRMTVAEAVTAATVNAAWSLGRGADIGSLEAGRRADIIVLDCPSHLFLGYRLGWNPVKTVVKEGRVVYRRPPLEVG